MSKRPPVLSTKAVTGNHLERIKFLISGLNILSAYMKT